MCFGLAVIGVLYLIQVALAIVVVVVSALVAWLSWSPLDSPGPVIGSGVAGIAQCNTPNVEIAVLVFASLVLAITVVVLAVVESLKSVHLVGFRRHGYGTCVADGGDKYEY